MAALIVAEQDGIEDRIKHLAAARSIIFIGVDVASGSARDTGAEKVSGGVGDTGMVGVIVSNLENRLGHEFSDSESGMSISWEGAGDVVDVSVEINGDEGSKELLVVEASSRWAEDDIRGGVGGGAGQSLEDRGHESGDGQSEKKVGEVVLIGLVVVIRGVGRWFGADMHIVEKDVAIVEGGAVGGEGRNGDFGVGAVVDELRHLGAVVLDEHVGGEGVREDVDGPDVCFAFSSGARSFESSFKVDRVGRGVDLLKFEDGGAAANSSGTGSGVELVRGHIVTVEVNLEGR